MKKITELLEQRPILLTVAVGLAFLLLYSFTMYRTVAPGDSGEVITAAWNFSPAHPPGFPVYIVCGWLWAHLLPLGDVAWRLNLFAAVCGAGIVICTMQAARGLATKFTQEGALVNLAAAVSAVALGLGHTMWHWSGIAEVYSLNTLILAALLAYILRNDADSKVRILKAAVLYGLGLGLHYSSTLFITPMLLAWLWAGMGNAAPAAARNAGPKKARGRKVRMPQSTLPSRLPGYFRNAGLGLGAALAVALLFYTILMLAAGYERMPNWGHPADLQRLFWHVSAKQFSVNLGLESLDQIGERVWPGIELWWLELSQLGFILGLFGWIRLLRQKSAWAWGIAATIALTFVYNTLYFIDVQDRESYHLPMYLCTALVLALETALLYGRLQRRIGSAKSVLTAMAVLLIFAAAQCLHNWRDSEHTRHSFHTDYVHNALSGLPADALVLTEEFELYSPYLYERYVEGRYPQPLVIDLLLWKDRPWYVEAIKRQYPELTEQWQPVLDNFLEQLYIFERGELRHTHEIASYYKQLLETMLLSTGKTLYCDSRALNHYRQHGAQRPGQDVPEGLFFRFYTGALPHSLPALDWNMAALTDAGLEPELTEKIVINQHVYMLDMRARYLQRIGKPQEAQAASAQADRIRAAFPQLNE